MLLEADLDVPYVTVQFRLPDGSTQAPRHSASFEAPRAFNEVRIQIMGASQKRNPCRKLHIGMPMSPKPETLSPQHLLRMSIS